MASDEALIEEVRKHPLLYDLALDDYKNLKKKERVWKEVAVKMKLDEMECKKRWKYLRDRYKLCKSQQNLASESDATIPKRKWRYMEILSFLDNVKSFRISVGNIPMDENELFEVCITPELCNDSTQFDEIGSESTMCSSMQNECAKLEEFLELASESITKMYDAFVENKPENTTTLIFKRLSLKIIEADMPLMEINKLESKVAALVFSEIEKYTESLE